MARHFVLNTGAKMLALVCHVHVILACVTVQTCFVHSFLKYTCFVPSTILHKIYVCAWNTGLYSTNSKKSMSPDQTLEKKNTTDFFSPSRAGCRGNTGRLKPKAGRS